MLTRIVISLATVGRQNKIKMMDDDFRRFVHPILPFQSNRLLDLIVYFSFNKHVVVSTALYYQSSHCNAKLVMTRRQRSRHSLPAKKLRTLFENISVCWGDSQSTLPIFCVFFLSSFVCMHWWDVIAELWDSLHLFPRVFLWLSCFFFHLITRTLVIWRGFFFGIIVLRFYC